MKNCRNCGLNLTMGCVLRDHTPDLAQGCLDWEEDYGQGDTPESFDGEDELD